MQMPDAVSRVSFDVSIQPEVILSAVEASAHDECVFMNDSKFGISHAA